MDGAAPKIALLLGAGASVDAGLPTVRRLTDTFQESLTGSARTRESSRDASAYQWLLSQLKGAGHDDPDIELILTALAALQERQQHALGAFVHNWKGPVATYDSAWPSLDSKLRRHLRLSLTVNRNQIDYLAPIKELIPPGGVLDVFTVNYDYTVELLCQERNIPYTDGFATYWDPAQFANLANGIRLHKLHGSLLWYQTSRPPKRIVKIPVAGAEGSVKFFSDDDVSTSVIYPVLVKEQHVDPYATILSNLRLSLASKDTLIVIGYSFRDAYIKDLIIEKMHENRDLEMVVIDPDAARVLVKSDSDVKSDWRFRSVSDRLHIQPDKASVSLRDGNLARKLYAAARGAVAQQEVDRRSTTGADPSPYVGEVIRELDAAERSARIVSAFGSQHGELFRSLTTWNLMQNLSWGTILIARAAGSGDADRWVRDAVRGLVEGCVLAFGPELTVAGSPWTGARDYVPDRVSQLFDVRRREAARAAEQLLRWADLLRFADSPTAGHARALAADCGAVEQYWGACQAGHQLQLLDGVGPWPAPANAGAVAELRRRFSDAGESHALSASA